MSRRKEKSGNQLEKELNGYIEKTIERLKAQGIEPTPGLILYCLWPDEMKEMYGTTP